MDRFQYNQIDVMRDSGASNFGSCFQVVRAGVSNSVLCLWLQRKYKVSVAQFAAEAETPKWKWSADEHGSSQGDNAKVNERLFNWVESVENRHNNQGTGPTS